jgi:hypothetical protein
MKPKLNEEARDFILMRDMKVDFKYAKSLTKTTGFNFTDQLNLALRFTRDEALIAIYNRQKAGFEDPIRIMRIVPPTEPTLEEVEF